MGRGGFRFCDCIGGGNSRYNLFSLYDSYVMPLLNAHSVDSDPMTDTSSLSNGRAAAAALQGITKTYYKPDGSVLVEALVGIDLAVQPGEFVAIMGPSGSGKSTLMNILGCLDQPTDGSYLLDGRDVATMEDDELSRVRGQKIGFIFQAFNLINQLNTLENVTMPLFYQGVPAGGAGPDGAGETGTGGAERPADAPSQ